MSIQDQLIYAIQTGYNVHLLCYLLSLKDADGRQWAAKAMCAAAEKGSGIDDCNIEGCRLLWGKLSRRAQKKYFAAKISSHQGSALGVASYGGNLKMVRLFIEEFEWNINQTVHHGHTPMYDAAKLLEVARFLLDNGADPHGGRHGSLWFAVRQDNTEVTQLLLVEYHANPNLNRRSWFEDEEAGQRYDPRNTDLAIQHGNEEILYMLLEHGAFVGHFINVRKGTSLNVFICKRNKSRAAKLSISSVLVEHAKEDHGYRNFYASYFRVCNQADGH
jgi:ankyrin repeat protein